MENPMVQIDLPLEEMMEAQRAEATLQTEEAQLAKISRRAEAANFVVTLAERNQQDPPHHQGCNVVCNVLFEGEFEQEEVGYTGAIVPLPANAKFGITSTMMQLLNMINFTGCKEKLALQRIKQCIAQGLVSHEVVRHRMERRDAAVLPREKKSRRAEEQNEDVGLPQKPLRRFGLRWVTKQEGKKWFKKHKESKYSHELFIDRKSLASEFPHIVNKLDTLGIGFVFNDLGECNLNMVREFLANWDPKERYDPKGIGMIKTKDPEGIHGPVLSISEWHERFNNMLSHLYGMQMLQLRMNGVTEEHLQQLNMDYRLSEHSRALCRVRHGFYEPLNDDDATDEEQARVDSDLESDDDEDDSEIGEAAFTPTDDED
ncbi:hypothetical protein HAX54_026878 [Datura stramonium]|uniref:Uncharacterized protein n=1 Tax=Datura stramonium TaxID=4076 RepID=A0ABS8V3B5_DATST|nr:hypothetical protein [Datura stramonium]